MIDTFITALVLLFTLLSAVGTGALVILLILIIKFIIEDWKEWR